MSRIGRGRRLVSLPSELAFSGQYLPIDFGAPHSSAATQEAHSVLDGRSRTRRPQRSQVSWEALALDVVEEGLLFLSVDIPKAEIIFVIGATI